SHGAPAQLDQQRPHPPVSETDPDPGRQFSTRHRLYRARPVHVAENQMPPQRATEAQRTLEVDGGARTQRTERSPRERLRAHLEGEDVGRAPDHGKADTADRDAGAAVAALERGRGGDLEPRHLPPAPPGPPRAAPPAAPAQRPDAPPGPRPA